MVASKLQSSASVAFFRQRTNFAVVICLNLVNCNVM